MTEEFGHIRRVLRSVRRRWMWQTFFRSATRASVSVAVVLLASWVLIRIVDPRALSALAWFAALTLASCAAVVGWALWPLTHRPGDAQVARFIEERCPHLEDRLVTAVECASSSPTPLTALMYRDAARRVTELDLDHTISRRAVARRGSFALASVLVLAAAAAISGPGLGRGVQAIRAFLSPGHLALRVLPGDARVAAGNTLRVEAQVANLPADVTPTLVLRDRHGVVRRRMAATSHARQFEYVVRPAEDFVYSVTAGHIASSDYHVAVVRAASVKSIDVHYVYPPALRLAPRTEENGGDVYAPAGTRVHLRIHTDKPVRSGSLLVMGASPAALATEGEKTLSGELTVSEDGSYRVTLTDGDGLENLGDTEYFIRMLTDTPPEVRIVSPGADREVTALEEVPIAAHAEDDHGVKDFDLVYSVRGGPETTVPFTAGGTPQSLDGKRTLYLEDLHVRPGDFVTYYARARDAANAVRANEARSDIFFLQVTPFEQEFMPPQSSQASAGAGAGNRSLDDLVRAQKQIIVATWKLDRRSRKSQGVGSADDIRTIGRAQGELKQRAMEAAGPTAMPRAAAAPKPSPQADTGDAMANAVDAMEKAERSLNAVNTSEALPHETRALTELMKAQANNRRWQMMQAGAGTRGEGDSGNQDLGSMFDHELKRQQRTNYEMPRSAGQRDEDKQQSDALERVRQLAERQSELTRQQQDLARDRAKLGEDEVKRRLERLTREQSDLRQQVEQLARQMNAENGRPQQAGGEKQQAGGGKDQKAGGKQQGGGVSAGELRDASDAMRQAAASLRDGKLDEAGARSGQAGDRLQSAERRVRSQQARSAPALGDLHLEAQQAAEAQRQIARDAASAEAANAKQAQPKGGGRSGDPALRRLAGEKERVADQIEQLAQGLKSAGASAGLDGRQRQAIEAVNKDLDRLQLPKQMRDQAAAMRAPEKGDVNRPPSAAGEQEISKTLDRLVDRLGAASGSGETRKASEQLGQTKETRDHLAELQRKVDNLQRQMAAGPTDSQQGKPAKAGDGAKSTQSVGTAGRGGDRAAELAKAQQEYLRELRRAADQLDRLGRDGGSFGLTPESARALSPTSAPGFHQDFSKWEGLSREVNAGLERAETVLTKKLRDQQARDRLQAPSSTRMPEQYRRLVEQYYESLARKDKR